MSKRTLVIVGVIAILFIGFGVFAWTAMNQSLYSPGTLHTGENLRGPLDPPAQSSDSLFWQVETDIQLHHFSQGQGRNVLVVHGGPGQPFLSPLPALDTLASQFTFHYYDQRGSGQSTRPIDAFKSKNFVGNMQEADRTLGLSAQLADIERIRRILGEEKLILVGHSFGGFLSALYAAEFPEHVESMILIAPAPLLLLPMEGDDLFTSIGKQLPEKMNDEYQRWMSEYMDFANLFKRTETDLVNLNEQFSKYYFTALGEKPAVQPPAGYAGGWMTFAMYLSMGQKHDYRPAMQAINAPVLVIHGANDLQTEAQSRTYSDALPNARFEVINNASHMVFNDQPEAFADLMRSFLANN